MTDKFLLFVLLSSISLCCKTKEEKLELKEDFTSSVFIADEGDYKCFRIPAIVKAKNGEILAFAEARKNGCSDTGDIDLVMKRSDDRGKSWGALQTIWDDSLNVCGNPAPIVDQSTGTINLLTTWNLGEDHESEIIAATSIDTRRIFIHQSHDHGVSWSAPKEITWSVKDSSWTWYATGPGSGLQISKGKYKDRLIVGCDHIEATSKKYYSHAIYSDDHGSTWQLGGTTPQDQVHECEIAERTDGSLLLNMRNYNREQLYRQTAISKDGGQSWQDQKHDKTLIEPICQASLQNLQVDGKHILAFSNPASKDSRTKMTIRLSQDDGASWAYNLQLSVAPAAYSDLVQTSENVLGCLYETGKNNPYEEIVYSSFTIHNH